jgi:hypothetical protein
MKFIIENDDMENKLLSAEEENLINNLYHKDDTWIQTYTGKKFYPQNPSLEDIDIEDIAHALSMQCRFTGHCKIHYSVAQHSVYVSYFAQNKLQGLLHDASEAYISDISSPVKRTKYLEQYKVLEKIVQNKIYEKFNVDVSESDDLKEADMLLLAIEVNSLVDNIHPDWKFAVTPPPFHIMELTPKEAKELFLKRFYELTKNGK